MPERGLDGQWENTAGRRAATKSVPQMVSDGVKLR